MPTKTIESDVVVIKASVNTLRSDSHEIKNNGTQSVDSLVLIGATLDQILLGVNSPAVRELAEAMGKLTEALNRNTAAHMAASNREDNMPEGY